MLISTQHNDGIDRDEVIRPDLIEHVIRPVIPEQFADDDYEVFVNPTGRFVIGGPVGDAGLTGRKIIVDTYGGMARHGGGAFSGKDPSARSTARPPTPPAGWPRTWSPPAPPAGARSRWPTPSAWPTPSRSWSRPSAPRTSTRPRSRTTVREVFDLRPAAIIRDLELRQPIFRQTAAYGHFGRETDGFTWERRDRVDAVKSALGL